METPPEAGGELIPLPEATSGTQKSEPSTKHAGAFGSCQRVQLHLLRLVQAAGLHIRSHSHVRRGSPAFLAPPSLAAPAGSLTGHARIAGKHSLSFPLSGGGSKYDLWRESRGFSLKANNSQC